MTIVRDQHVVIGLLRSAPKQFRKCASDRSRKAVDDQIVPLVEDRDSPVAVGKTGKAEGPVGVALGEREIFLVRIAQAHVALGETGGIVRTAAIEPLIRRTAQARGRNPAGE